MSAMHITKFVGSLLSAISPTNRLISYGRKLSLNISEKTFPWTRCESYDVYCTMMECLRIV